MRQGTRAAIVAALLAVAAAPLAAQVRGMPVYNSGVPRGIGLYGDVGFPNDEAGGGNAFAVTGRAGFGAFGATAMLSTYNPDGPAGSDVSVGATANYRVFGGPLVPLCVTLQAGVGYAKPDEGVLPDEEVSQWRFPDRCGLHSHHSQPGPRHQTVARAAARHRDDVTRRRDDEPDETRNSD